MVVDGEISLSEHVFLEIDVGCRELSDRSGDTRAAALQRGPINDQAAVICVIRVLLILEYERLDTGLTKPVSQLSKRSVKYLGTWVCARLQKVLFEQQRSINLGVCIQITLINGACWPHRPGWPYRPRGSTAAKVFKFDESRCARPNSGAPW